MKFTEDNLLNIFDEVFLNKIETLKAVKGSARSGFGPAVRLIFESKGKVVVTGIGKSGLIGQKIAATLASTGTLAVFLHAAEALHGDLGIIKNADVVIAIGKSGESDELIAMLSPIREIGAKIIAITSNSESTLAKQADVVIFAKVEKEADTLNLAPTSSTTAALVIGDAIAIALMRVTDFQEDRFALFHPGGRLGKRLLLKVRDIMRGGDNNPVITKADSLQSLLYKITEKRSGAISVIDDNGKLLGLVTDFDIRKVLESKNDFYSSTIEKIMNPDPVFVYDDEKAVVALDIMEKRDKPLVVLPVVARQTGQVTGMIHLHDLLSYRI